MQQQNESVTPGPTTTGCPSRWTPVRAAPR